LLLLAALTALALLAPAGVARAQMPQTAPSDVPAAPDYFTEVRGNPLDYEDLADHVFASSASQGTSIPRLADGRMHLERTQTMDVAWVYAGFAPGAFAIGTEGLALPVDADRYTAASFRAWSPVRTTAAILFDKCGPDAGRCTGSSQNFFIEPGWRTYQVPLVSGGPSGWNGRVAEVRLTVAGDGTPHELQVDWVRLYRPTAAVPVRAIGSQLYWDADDDQANNTPENPGWGLLAEGPAVLTATFPADAYPPGTYRFFTEMGPAQTGPITVGAPLPVLLDPDAAGGDDYATVETGDAWDFSQPSDVTHLENVGALDWSGGRLSTVNGGADPSNSFMDLRLGAPVDTARYHRLTVVTELQGAFDLGFGAGGGSHGRLLWHGDQSGSTFIHNSKEVVLYPFLSEYTVDLATDPGSAVHETDDPARPGWTGLVDRVRWDPNEDPGPRAWYIDELRLAADDETSGGFFDVRWEDRSTTATDGTMVSLYYDTDGAGFDGRAIATDVEQVEG
jgi:hypothetical protein